MGDFAAGLVLCSRPTGNMPLPSARDVAGGDAAWGRGHRILLLLGARSPCSNPRSLIRGQSWSISDDVGFFKLLRVLPASLPLHGSFSQRFHRGSLLFVAHAKNLRLLSRGVSAICDGSYASAGPHFAATISSGWKAGAYGSGPEGSQRWLGRARLYFQKRNVSASKASEHGTARVYYVVLGCS